MTATTNDASPQTAAGREQAERVHSARERARVPSVDQAWNAVMRDVLAVGKTGFAKTFGEGGGGFKFRGVDAVVDAVGPALRAHGVTVLPKKIIATEAVEYETKKGSKMVNKQVRVRWEVRGPAGDTFTGESVGEAADSGDKAMSKAQSVAYRVFLLQALCIPTGETDPDENVHERASAQRGEAEPDPQLEAEIAAANDARGELLTKTQAYGWTADKLLARFWDDYHKNLRNTRDLDLIRSFGEVLVEEGKAAPARVQGTGQERVAPVHDEGPPPAPGPTPEPPVTLHQMRKLHALFKDNAITEEEQHQWLTDALGIPVESKKNLTTSEAERAIVKLETLKTTTEEPR